MAMPGATAKANKPILENGFLVTFEQVKINLRLAKKLPVHELQLSSVR